MKLTPLGNAIVKGSAAITILSVMGGAAWYLTSHKDAGDTTPGAPEAKQEKHGFFSFGGGDAAPEATATATVASGALGTQGNPLKVSLNSFLGFAPGILANGGSLTTQPGSINANAGIYVEYVIQDNIPTLAENFGANTTQCVWRTIDFWSQEHTGLRGAGYDGRMIMLVDNSRGGDGVVARGDINTVEDLAGHKVALLQYTPSDWLLRWALGQSSLSGKKLASIDYVYVAAEDGTAGVKAAFTSGQVDAAVLWEPDLSFALKADPKAHILTSTELATSLIYDGIVCEKKAIDANPKLMQAFVDGWFAGVDEAQAAPAKATTTLLATMPFYADLAKQEGAPYLESLYKGVLWEGLSENIRDLGLAGESNSFDRIYSEADRVWRDAGAIANPNAAVINPDDAFDYTFVHAAMGRNAKAKEEAKVPAFTFTEVEKTAAVKQVATVTKPVTINFDMGSAELTKKAMATLDKDVVPLIESTGSAYFSIEGNTDSTGSAAVNTKLSKSRADAVTKYLVSQWEIDPNRFTVVGNGPSKPVCDEKNPDGTLEECQAANRRTDIAVHAR